MGSPKRWGKGTELESSIDSWRPMGGVPVAIEVFPGNTGEPTTIVTDHQDYKSLRSDQGSPR